MTTTYPTAFHLLPAPLITSILQLIEHVENTPLSDENRALIDEEFGRMRSRIVLELTKNDDIQAVYAYFNRSDAFIRMIIDGMLEQQEEEDKENIPPR